METINVIEPTLSSQAGHCYSFVNSLLRASSGQMAVRLWVNVRAVLEFSEGRVEVHQCFYRWSRRLQSYWLYRKLLTQPGKMFLSTATYTDLRLFDLAAKGTVPLHKAYFYVHWFNPDPDKLRHLRRIALKQPHLSIFGPTVAVVNIFKEAGFSESRLIPYPISVRNERAVAAPFRHLLFAGAARRDKGFDQVVNLVELLHAQQASIPITIQISAEHFGKYDKETQSDIRRLQEIAYPHLNLVTETLGVDEYAALFNGGIALQFYSVNDFSDRISGVTLDAFSAGCPVITTAGTWISRMVGRFDAGIVVERLDPASLLVGIERMISEYGHYAGSAMEAGSVLQKEHNAAALYEALKE